MPRVKVTKPYFDKVREEYPEVNSEFEVEEKRAGVLVNAGVCEIVVEEQNDGEPAEKPKKTTKKAKSETK